MARISLSGDPLSAQEARELRHALGSAADDASLRAVILESAGEDFCPGPGAGLVETALDTDPAAALAAVRPPVIAAVAGRAHSVGLELLLATDVRIVTDDASFSLPDLSSGRLPCWGGTQRLPRIVGHTRATAMLLLGSAMDAAEALRCGLAQEVVPRRDLEQRVGAVVEHVLELGPLALEYAKEAVRIGSELPMRDGLRLEGDLNSLLQASQDRCEGIAAFSDKRTPRFVGR